MQRHGCLIVFLLVLGVIGAYSDPQEAPGSDVENREEATTETSDSSEQYEDTYEDMYEGMYEDYESVESSGERVKRDMRRRPERPPRQQRILEADEYLRMEHLAQYLMQVTQYYEQVLHLSHEQAVQRMLAEYPNEAQQVMTHAERRNMRRRQFHH